MTYRCTGCGRTTDNPEMDLRKLHEDGKISCCPERKMVSISNETLDMLASLCDAMKRLEQAVSATTASDREHYLSECKKRRNIVEKRILKLSVPEGCETPHSAATGGGYDPLQPE